MSLFDSLAGALGSGKPGGGQGDMLQAVIALIAQVGGQGGSQGGGLAGLVQQLQQAGLGEAVNSWIGSGANQPVSPEQLGGALSPDTVAGFAQQLGLDKGAALAMLSQLLPQVVDKLTPGGQVPAGGGMDLSQLGGLGELGGMLGGLLGKR